MGSTATAEGAAREAVASVPLWYHTIELAAGVVTPGWFDLRPVIDRMPWPDLHGKRCLDVGPWDGFLAFEMERRGAAEVVAAEISDFSQWDMPAALRARGAETLRQMAGQPGGGFPVAKRVLNSSVERVEVNVYDLSPERVGTFDFVVCGALMLHLRDPVRGLEAIRGVCDGHFLSAEQIRLGISVRHRRMALAEFMAGRKGQWWVPNRAGHRALLQSAGFAIERAAPPYAVPLGPAHPDGGPGAGTWGHRLLVRAVARGPGMPYSALLARPAI